MPLHKRKPFSLLQRPDDLKPDELVFQIRFTKEIFRDYCEYLNRINLYRQRVWTCKSTGKSNLTYEEALVSEKQANEKIQQFPKELMEPVLRDVQFSMLHLKELVSTIAAKLQERLLEGTEIYGRKNNRIYPCKIVKVIDEKVEKTQYLVEWLDKDKKVTENAVVSGEDLIKKKLPFSRDVLKAFIKESTYRSSPWVLHDKLALKYGISTSLPEELRSKISPKRKLSTEDKEANNGERKRKKQKDEAGKEDDVPIKYPIDDLKVKPAADDPVFTPRPPPTRNFNIPAECVGDALMVWDFCSSYSKLLNLSPFSLDDFENALCYKESNIVLIVESHAALLRLLIKEEGDYFIAIQKKKRKQKITLMTWTDYLCDFMELTGNEELTTHMSTIKRGHYGLLDINAKLGIFRELIGQVLASDIMREKLDEFIEERHALVAKKRGEALEEGRKRREKKEMAKAESNGNVHNGDVGKTHKDKNSSAEQKDSPEISGKKQDKTSAEDVKNVMVDTDVTIASMKASNGKGSQKAIKHKDKNSSAEQKDSPEISGKKQDKTSEKDVKNVKVDTEVTIASMKASNVGKKHKDKNSSAEQKDSLEISGKKQDKTSEKDVKNVKVDTDVTIASMKASNGKGSQKAIKHKDKNSSAEQKDSPEISGKKQDKTSEKDVKNVKVDTDVTIASMKASNGKGSQKAIDVEKKETKDKINIEQKKEKLEREMEKWLIRTNPLGKDRDYNRYWFFRKDTRIFVESCDHKQWGYYTTKPELDSLMGSLNEKGERERALKRQLEKRYNKISGEMHKKSKEAHRIQMEEEALLRRSSRVRAPPRENPARAFLKYVNQLKED